MIIKEFFSQRKLFAFFLSLSSIDDIQFRLREADFFAAVDILSGRGYVLLIGLRQIEQTADKDVGRPSALLSVILLILSSEASASSGWSA